MLRCRAVKGTTLQTPLAVADPLQERRCRFGRIGGTHYSFQVSRGQCNTKDRHRTLGACCKLQQALNLRVIAESPVIETRILGTSAAGCWMPNHRCRSSALHSSCLPFELLRNLSLPRRPLGCECRFAFRKLLQFPRRRRLF